MGETADNNIDLRLYSTKYVALVESIISNIGYVISVTSYNNGNNNNRNGKK